MNSLFYFKITETEITFAVNLQTDLQSTFQLINASLFSLRFSSLKFLFNYS